MSPMLSFFFFFLLRNFRETLRLSKYLNETNPSNIWAVSFFFLVASSFKTKQCDLTMHQLQAGGSTPEDVFLLSGCIFPTGVQSLHKHKCTGTHLYSSTCWEGLPSGSIQDTSPALFLQHRYIRAHFTMCEAVAIVATLFTMSHLASVAWIKLTYFAQQNALKELLGLINNI